MILEVSEAIVLSNFVRGYFLTLIILFKNSFVFFFARLLSDANTLGALIIDFK